MADHSVPSRLRRAWLGQHALFRARQRLLTYLRALGLVALGLLAAYAAKRFESLADEAMISLLSVAVVALLFDRRVAVVATLSNILAFDYFFVHPRWAFAPSDAENIPTFVTMLLVAVLMNGVSQKLRNQERMARRSAEIARGLYEMNAELMAAQHPRQMIATATRYIERLFAAPACVLLPTAEATLEVPPEFGAVAQSLAERAFRSGEFSALPPSAGHDVWVPILGSHAVLGVIGLDLAEEISEASEHGRLLSACARELATALERARLAGAVHRSQLEAETERMRSSLLSAVSHDLKTPLSAIVTAATTLSAHRNELDSEVQDALLASIVGEGDRLHRLVQNLLSVTRLEAPSVELRQSPESLEEILAATLEHLEFVLGRREIDLDVPADLPCVLAEPVLVEQVISNLIENALRHTAASTPISISARVSEGFMAVSVADRGAGIPEHERDRVFEKFYRGSRANKSDGGVGLGLTICRAIVRAHGGRIAIRGRLGGGTVVEFTLPIAVAGIAPEWLTLQ